jgi:hypothetical protein
MTTFIEPKIFENPDPGEHTAVLADVVDLQTVNTKFGPRKMCKLIFLTDQNGVDGKPLAVHVRLGKTRWKTGKLIEFVRALTGRYVLSQDDWILDGHIGKCVGLDLVHVQREEATFANVVRVFPLGKTAPRLKLPLDYVRQEDRDTSFAGDQPQPPAAPAYPTVTQPAAKVKIVPAATSSETRAAAANAELAKRDKQPRVETGQQEEKGGESLPLA